MHTQAQTHTHSHMYKAHIYCGIHVEIERERTHIIILCIHKLPTSDPCIFLMILTIFPFWRTANEFFVTRQLYLVGSIWNGTIWSFKRANMRWLRPKCLNEWDFMSEWVSERTSVCLYLFDAINGIWDAWMAFVRYAPVCTMDGCLHTFSFVGYFIYSEWAR